MNYTEEPKPLQESRLIPLTLEQIESITKASKKLLEVPRADSLPAPDSKAKRFWFVANFGDSYCTLHILMENELTEEGSDETYLGRYAFQVFNFEQAKLVLKRFDIELEA